MYPQRHVTLGHSPDPDDAFMFYGLAAGKFDTFGWTFEHVLQDIQTLNDRAIHAELDITAVSIHAYPFVAQHYALTSCGCSMGDGYGPIVVAARPVEVSELCEMTIAVPGERTTAFLALNLLLGRGAFRHKVVTFDRILSAVARREAEAGLIIHEGQLTYRDQKLHKVVDLGAWWKEKTGLPLPLGGNAIRRALGRDAMVEVTGILRSSIEFGLKNRDEAVQYALRFGRDLDRRLTDQFVGLYVNDWTLDYGDVGRRAVRELLRCGHEIGMVPAVPEIEFVSP